MTPAKYPIRISGMLITTPLDGGPEVHEPTVSCCHCGRTWAYKPGSGRKRGYCLRCMNITCGKEACMACRPYEQLLENIEQGQPEEHRRIIAPGGWEGGSEMAA